MSAHDDEFPTLSKAACNATDDMPRRCYLAKFTPFEVAAFELVRACEIAGAHPLLTQAQALASRAKDLLAEWIESAALMTAANGKPELLEPGEWNPLQFDPDYPRPWITKPSAESPDTTTVLVDYGAGGRTTEPESELKRWRVLTQDGSWIEGGGNEIRRDDDWIEIVGRGTRHCFHRPQSVEQIQ